MRPAGSRFRLSTALLLAAACLPAAAQESDPLYRVELLIISHEGNLGAERWEPFPDLAYPAAARFLVDDDRLDASLREFPGDAELDAYGRQLITMPPDPDADPGAGRAQPAAPAADAPTADPMEPLVRPFHLLEKSTHELNTWGVRRSGRYRVLFHEAWVQPVPEQARALPIVLDRSGDTGEWPAWQGSILIYLSRFLHLETRLWLNTRGNYFPEGWTLPPAPLGPPSVLVDGMPPYRYREAKLAEALAEQAEQAAAAAYPGLPTIGSDETAADGAEDPEAEPAEPLWPWRHSVLVSEQRRMRSEEVHYLDHPLLGVVVKLTPVDLDALEAERQVSAVSPALSD